MNEKFTNKAIVKFCQSKFENHIPTKLSVFCQQILSLKRARLVLVSRRLKKNISDNDNAILLTDFPQKLKFGKTHGILITLSYVNSLFFCSATKYLLSSLKN